MSDGPFIIFWIVTIIPETSLPLCRETSFLLKGNHFTPQALNSSLPSSLLYLQLHLHPAPAAVHRMWDLTSYLLEKCREWGEGCPYISSANLWANLHLHLHFPSPFSLDKTISLLPSGKVWTTLVPVWSNSFCDLLKAHCCLMESSLNWSVQEFTERLNKTRLHRWKKKICKMFSGNWTTIAIPW